MSNLVNLREYKLKKGIQDSLNNEESGFVMKKVGLIKEGLYRIMSPNLKSIYFSQNIFDGNPKSRRRQSEEVLEKWAKEYKLDFNYRRNKEPNIKIDNNGVFLGDIYWAFDFIFEDSFKNGETELLKFGLKIPTKKDVEESIKYLPGKNQTEKIENLFLILGFNQESIYKIEMFISQNHGLKFNSKTGNLIQKLSQKINSLIGEYEVVETISLSNENLYSSKNSNLITTICGIKK